MIHADIWIYFALVLAMCTCMQYVHLRSLIILFCHTPISLTSQDSAARFNFIVGIGDRMGQGAIGHVNYSLTCRSILGVSPALHEKKR